MTSSPSTSNFVVYPVKHTPYLAQALVNQIRTGPWFNRGKTERQAVVGSAILQVVPFNEVFQKSPSWKSTLMSAKPVSG
jgi:hypothetical protein